jgi:hypothetical protein
MGNLESLGLTSHAGVREWSRSLRLAAAVAGGADAYFSAPVLSQQVTIWYYPIASGFDLRSGDGKLTLRYDPPHINVFTWG